MLEEENRREELNLSEGRRQEGDESKGNLKEDLMTNDLGGINEINESRDDQRDAKVEILSSDFEGNYEITDFRGKYLVPAHPTLPNLFTTNINDMTSFLTTRVACSDTPHSFPWKIANSPKCPGSFTISTIFDNQTYFWQTSLNFVNKNQLCLMVGDPHDWESFVIQVKNNIFNIKSVCNGFFVSSENGKMTVSCAKPFEWEQFSFYKL